jgi:hypothetical protein
VQILTPSYWLHGGFEVAISRTVHPKLQISTARLQPFAFFITYINHSKGERMEKNKQEKLINNYIIEISKIKV